jgi:hypothetical protein
MEVSLQIITLVYPTEADHNINFYLCMSEFRRAQLEDLLCLLVLESLRFWTLPIFRYPK